MDLLRNTIVSVVKTCIFIKYIFSIIKLQNKKADIATKKIADKKNV